MPAIGGIAGVTLLVAATWWAWNASAQEAEAPAHAYPAPRVAVAPVLALPVPRQLQGVGELEARHQVAVAAEVAGQVVEIGFTPGEAVAAGAVLLRLNDAVERAEWQGAQARLTQANAVLKRTQALQGERAATQAQLEAAQAERDTAASLVRQWQARVAQKTVRAPFAGVTGVQQVHLGQYLAPGTPVTTLVDDSQWRVNFSLDEAASATLAVGQPVQVQLSGWPGAPLAGTVRVIDPMVSASRLLRVQAELLPGEGAATAALPTSVSTASAPMASQTELFAPVTEREADTTALPTASAHAVTRPALQSGRFAQVTVQQPAGPPAAVVPETAVTYTAYGETVFVVRESAESGARLQRVAVRSGERWAGRVEILQGLTAGEQVVVAGQVSLSDGMAVQPVSAEALPLPELPLPALAPVALAANEVTLAVVTPADATAVGSTASMGTTVSSPVAVAKTADPATGTAATTASRPPVATTATARPAAQEPQP